MQTAFCAICTMNYFSYSKVLFDSLKSVGYKDSLYLLIIDYQKKYIELINSQGINIVTLDSLQIPEINELIEKYNPFELCNVLKPYFLSWILNKYPKYNNVIYLDSDIYVYSPLTEVIDYINNSNYSVLLLPNISSKSSMLKETNYSEETLFFRAGLYCGGFYILKNDDKSKTFLKWQQTKLRQFGYNSQNSYMFVDQKILDFAPLLFDFVSVYHHIGYNVGHWNYSENKINIVNTKYYVNDKPLVFFHFSFLKIDVDNPENDKLFNIELKNDSLLHNLCKEYWDNVIKISKYSEIKSIKYGHLHSYNPPLIEKVDPVQANINELKTVKALNDELKTEIEQLKKSNIQLESEFKNLEKQLHRLLNSRSVKTALFLSKVLHMISNFPGKIRKTK